MLLEAFKKLMDARDVVGMEAHVAFIVETAKSPDATKGDIALAFDICEMIGRDNNALDLLLLLERRFGLDDVGYNNLAFIYSKLGDTIKAIEFYRKSWSLNEGNLVSLKNLAFFSIEEDQSDSLELCRKFYDLSGKSKDSVLYLATILYNKGLMREFDSLKDEWLKVGGEEDIFSDFKL